jgi:hypothetical protein
VRPLKSTCAKRHSGEATPLPHGEQNQALAKNFPENLQFIPKKAYTLINGPFYANFGITRPPGPLNTLTLPRCFSRRASGVGLAAGPFARICMLREVVKRAIVSFAAVFIVSLGALSFVG